MGEAVLTRRKGAASKKITVDGASYPYTNSAAVSGKSVTINTSAAVTNKYSNIATFTPTINNLWYMRVKVVFDTEVRYKTSSSSSLYYTADLEQDATQEFYAKVAYANGQEIVLGTVTYAGATRTLTVTVKLAGNKLRFEYSWSGTVYDIGASQVTQVSYELFWD